MSATPSLTSAVEEWRIRVEEDAWDVAAWEAVIVLAADAPAQEASIARCLFDAAITVFPTCVRYWIAYIKLEMRLERWAAVEDLFQDALHTMPDARLWHLYLDHMRRTKRGTRDEHAVIQEAYEFVLAQVGGDVHAQVFWREYIDYISSIPVTCEEETVGKNETLQRIYQRALQQPLQELDWFWVTYAELELTTNKTLGQTLLNEYKPKYLSSKERATERLLAWNPVFDHPLHSTYIPHPLPSPQGDEGVVNNNHEIASYHRAWKAAIAYETKCCDADRDDDLQNMRAMLAFRQALLALRHFPDVWYDYVAFIEKLSMPSDSDASSTVSLPEVVLSEIRQVWQTCTQAISYSPLPTLLYSEWEERGNRGAAAVAVLNDRIADYEVRASKQVTVVVGASRITLSGLFADKSEIILPVQLYRLSRRIEGVEQAGKQFLLLRRGQLVSPYLYALLSEVFVSEPIKARHVIDAGRKAFPASDILADAYLQFLLPTAFGCSNEALEAALAALERPAPPSLNPNGNTDIAYVHPATRDEPPTTLLLPWCTRTDALALACRRYLVASRNAANSFSDILSAERACQEALRDKTDNGVDDAFLTNHPIVLSMDRLVYRDLTPCWRGYLELWSRPLPTSSMVVRNQASSAQTSLASALLPATSAAPPTLTPPTIVLAEYNSLGLGPRFTQMLQRLPSKVHFKGPYMPVEALMRFLTPLFLPAPTQSVTATSVSPPHPPPVNLSSAPHKRPLDDGSTDNDIYHQRQRAKLLHT